ncbi:MAG: hypothetical protein WBG90_05585 [Saonia sp.]
MSFLPTVPKPNVLLLPLVGMVFFILFYIIAAISYPGGSHILPDQIGFSFWNNYLCDLLDRYAINGELNSARFVARTSLAVLCVSLLLLWAYLPGFFSVKSMNQKIMLWTGMASFVVTLFLTAKTHDSIVRIAGVFGAIAFISCFIELFKARHFKLFVFGLICLLIFLGNFYIYETGSFLNTLPIFQKVTFVCCLIWFAFLNISFYRKLKSEDVKDAQHH